MNPLRPRPVRRGRPLFVARRRHRGWRVVLVASAVLLGAWTAASGAPLVATGGVPGIGGEGEPDETPASPDGAGAAAGDAGEAPAATAPLAAVRGARLRVPTPRPMVVGYHEASTPRALELAPLGRATANENTTKFDPPRPEDGGQDYLVLSSRGRRQAATSAVDVVMRADDPVRSPVTGTVTGVRSYDLYGTHEDHRIEIAPHAARDLRVVLIHLEEPAVAVGDEVSAGRSVLAAGARSFPFGSQIDRYTEPDRWPHVHIEVKGAGADRRASLPR